MVRVVRIRYSYLFFLILTIINSTSVRGQSGTSSAISGTVTDPTGAALANAAITANEVDTKAGRSVETDQNGRFLFSQVNPGIYTVTVAATGFAQQTSRPIMVEVGRTATLSFNLFVSAGRCPADVAHS